MGCAFGMKKTVDVTVCVALFVSGAFVEVLFVAFVKTGVGFISDHLGDFIEMQVLFMYERVSYRHALPC